MGNAALLVAPLLAAVGTYLIAARQLSGRIDHSEARELWTESASMREDYRERLASSEKRQADLEARVADCERIANQLRIENMDLRHTNEEQAQKIDSLQRRIDELERDNAALRSRLRGADA